MKILSWIVALLGLWEFGDVVAPFVPGFGRVPPFMWNHIVVGMILMLIGAWAALTSDLRLARTLRRIAAVAGAWLMLASFVLGMPLVNAGLWNDVIVGALVLILNAWAALRISVVR